MSVAVFTGTRLTLSAREKEILCNVLALYRVSDARYVLVGDGPGVDAYVREVVAHVPGPERLKVFDADWKTHAAAAGPMRNRAMLTEALALAHDRSAVHVYAFPSPSSKGTWDCVKAAAALDIRASVYPVGVR